MDASSQSVIPLGSIDRMVGSFVGGSDTGTYYTEAYGVQPVSQGQTIPVESITITPQLQTGAMQNQQGAPIHNVQMQQTVQQKNGVDISPPAVASTIIQGVFSFAVTASIICAIFVLYVIIRSRQLHHHEEHIRGVGHGGHGDTHGKVAQQEPAPAVAHTNIQHEVPGVPSEHPSAFMPVSAHDETSFSVQPSVQAHDDGQADTISTSDGEEIPLVDISDPLAIRHHALQLYIESPEEHDWRYALMDMDLLLDDALLRKGYIGNNTEDKLSRLNSSVLHSHESAIQAHDAYIQLTADDTLLTHESIKNLYALYEPVFKELCV